MVRAKLDKPWFFLFWFTSNDKILEFDYWVIVYWTKKLALVHVWNVYKLFSQHIFFSFIEEPPMSRLSKKVSYANGAEIPPRKSSSGQGSNLYNLWTSCSKHESTPFSSQQREKTPVWQVWLSNKSHESIETSYVHPFWRPVWRSKTQVWNLPKGLLYNARN